MRPIDADELEKCFSLTLHGREVYNAEEILMTIQTAPTIEPAPTAFIPAFTITSTDGQAEVRLVPERRGKWIWSEDAPLEEGQSEYDREAWYQCSECDAYDLRLKDSHANYCWSCGAKMDDDEVNDEVN